MKSYKKILKKAKKVKRNVKNNQKLGATTKWSYYFAKAILTGDDVKSINFSKAPSPTGEGISRQIPKKDYMNLAKDLVEFVEKNHRLPNYLTYNSVKIKPRLYTVLFARIIVFHDKHNRWAKKAKINSKWFSKPVETNNAVYNYACKKYGKQFKTIDEVLSYVQGHFRYQGYFDDHKSNKTVTDEKSGNCVDLLHWLCNMAEAMGYDWKCIHVRCKSSGTGHVYGRFRHSKHTGGNWITRDPASVASGNNINSVWCSNGTVQAVNPAWWMDNLRR